MLQRNAGLSSMDATVQLVVPIFDHILDRHNTAQAKKL